MFVLIRNMMFHLIFAFQYNTPGESSNRSSEVFNILAKLSNIQKIPLFDRNVFYIRSEYTNYLFDR